MQKVGEFFGGGMCFGAYLVEAGVGTLSVGHGCGFRLFIMIPESEPTRNVAMGVMSSKN